MTPRKVLLIVGSPRGRPSVSQTLADYLAQKLAFLSVQTEILQVTAPTQAPDILNQSRLRIEAADAYVLVFPLSTGQLPSGTIKFLEYLSQHRKTQPPSKNQALMAVINSRLPEAGHNDNALAVVRRFAELEGLDWLGGLTFNGSRILSPGEALEKGGGRTFRVVRALDIAAYSLADFRNKPIPDSAIEPMRELDIPYWLYRFLTNLSFKWKARPKRGSSSNASQALLSLNPAEFVV